MARTPFRFLGQSLLSANSQGLVATSGSSLLLSGGAASTLNGGGVSIQGGAAVGDGDGGNVALQAGGGGGTVDGRGGSVSLNAGNAAGTSASGGDILLTAGNSNNVNNGGRVLFQTGTGLSGGSVRAIAAPGGVQSLRTHNSATSLLDLVEQTYAAQIVHANSSVTNITLGSCPSFSNTKIDMYVVGKDQNSTATYSMRYIQTWTASLFAPAGSLTAHLNHSATSGIPPFVGVQVVASTFDIVLRITANSVGGPFTWNWSIFWSRQRGGFTP